MKTLYNSNNIYTQKIYYYTFMNSILFPLNSLNWMGGRNCMIFILYVYIRIASGSNAKLNSRVECSLRHRITFVYIYLSLYLFQQSKQAHLFTGVYPDTPSGCQDMPEIVGQVYTHWENCKCPRYHVRTTFLVISRDWGFAFASTPISAYLSRIQIYHDDSTTVLKLSIYDALGAFEARLTFHPTNYFDKLKDRLYKYTFNTDALSLCGIFLCIKKKLYDATIIVNGFVKEQCKSIICTLILYNFPKFW